MATIEHAVLNRVLWVADDESYGAGKVIVIDLDALTDEQVEAITTADDAERWDTALTIIEMNIDV